MAELEQTEDRTLAQHKNKFRGRCAIALEWNSRITHALANGIRISPMHGCTDLGTIDACRRYVATMTVWLDRAEESARAVAAAEAEGGTDA